MNNKDYIKGLKFLIEAGGSLYSCSTRRDTDLCRKCKYHIDDKEYSCSIFYEVLNNTGHHHNELSHASDALPILQKEYEIEIKRLIESE